MGLALQKLTASERAAIARELFAEDENKSTEDEIWGLCPIHKEQDASFSYNVTKDTYHCFACHASGDLIKLWTKVKSYGDNREGFKAFCEQYGIDNQRNHQTDHASQRDNADNRTAHKRPSESKKEVPLPELDGVLKLLPPLPESWIHRLVKTRGWSRDAILEMDLRLQTHYQAKKTGTLVKVRKPERIAIPVKDDQGICRNLRLYKPGGDPKIISWGKKYGGTRSFPATPQEEGAVLLCEGESDTLCALSHGFNAITQTSKPRKWRQEHLRPFKGRDVIIAYDADQAGQTYVSFSGDNLAKVAKSVKVLIWPDAMGRQQDGHWPKDKGQDLTDFFVKHGKTADDLQALIDAAGEYIPAPTRKDPVFDDQGPMEFFVRGVNDRMSYKPRLLAEKILQDIDVMSEPKTDLLYKWNDRHWEPFEESHINAMGIKYLGIEADRNRTTNATFIVKNMSALPHGREVNDRADWICLKNGMLNLKTKELKPHAKDYYATFELNVEYDENSDARCERWLQFLDETIRTPAVIAQVQEFAGYCLTREVKHAKCLLLLGPGSDGKSVLLKMLRHLVGPENCSSVGFQDLEKEFQRSSLYNKLLNISTEVGSSALESPYFKAITSGDPISAAFKHKNFFNFEPYCKLAFAANKMPRVLDNSDGFFRRVLPIQFKQQFKEGDPRTDPDLESKLLGELSEIFHWALVGLHRLWKQKRFTICGETDELLMGYRRSNNPVLCFAEDECSVGEGEAVAKKEIFGRYRQYCTKGNYVPKNEENFFRDLYAAIDNLNQYRPRIDGKRPTYISGIGLKSVFGGE